MDHGEAEYQAARTRMIEGQLRRRGISDRRVLEAMSRVPRHCFVPDEVRPFAYDDRPLPIGEGQTISQPYIVAQMTEALSLAEDQSVLEIGTGSGYQTAILASLVRVVFTVERCHALYHRARATLSRLGIDNVRCTLGDGTVGLAESAPFDRVVATGSLPTISRPLLEHLSRGGVFVGPIGSRFEQQLVRVSYDPATGDWERVRLCWCRFVPLIGAAGWTEPSSIEDSGPRRKETA